MVAFLSCLTGLFVAGQISRGVIFVLPALVLYVNSKQALTHWLRSKGRNSLEPLTVFISQIMIATFLLGSVAWHDLPEILPLAVIPALYLSLWRLKGEHFLFTEITGFFLLALAAPLSEFASSGRIDMKLYAATAVFFAAGVFKVRLRLTRQNLYRILMIAYLVFAASIYHLLALPFILLVPLTDNMVFAGIPYKIKLRTAGRLEAAKGVLFVILIATFYGAR